MNKAEFDEIKSSKGARLMIATLLIRQALKGDRAGFTPSEMESEQTGRTLRDQMLDFLKREGASL